LTLVFANVAQSFTALKIIAKYLSIQHKNTSNVRGKHKIKSHKTKLQMYITGTKIRYIKTTVWPKDIIYRINKNGKAHGHKSLHNEFTSNQLSSFGAKKSTLQQHSSVTNNEKL
jgi:hypothetical protein